MGTNGYQPAHVSDPLGHEQVPAAWRPAKWPTPGRTLNLVETVDMNMKDHVNLAILEKSRLPVKKAERSAAARLESLMSVSVVIGSHHEIEGLFSALASELLRVVDFDFIGMSQNDEATKRVDWHLSKPDGAIERGTIDGTKEETISAWVYQHQKPLDRKSVV